MSKNIGDIHYKMALCYEAQKLHDDALRFAEKSYKIY